MAKKLTSSKAKEILRDGEAHGHPLTSKQKRYMGWVAGGKKAENGGWLSKYQDGGEVRDARFQLKQHGIVDEQRLKPNIIRDRFAKNIENEYFTDEVSRIAPVKRLFNAIVLNKSEKSSFDPNGTDAINMYLGKPQKNNTFDISNYQPTITKNKSDKQPLYYSIPNKMFIRNILKEVDKNPDSDRFQMNDMLDVLGDFTVTKGSDEKGDYVSYYDRYDVNPYKGRYSAYSSKIDDISMGIGKPYEVYDRIYYEDNPNYKVDEYQAKIDSLTSRAKKLEEEDYWKNIEEMDRLYGEVYNIKDKLIHNRYYEAKITETNPRHAGNYIPNEKKIIPDFTKKLFKQGGQLKKPNQLRTFTNGWVDKYL